MKKPFFIIIILSLSRQVFGQGRIDNTCFANIYIDRPLLKKDSLAIITNNISKIKLYESVSNDSIPKRTLIGQWSIAIDKGKIKSTKWTAFTDSSFIIKNPSFILLGCYPLEKRNFNKNKIIDIVGVPNYSDDHFSQFQLTHLINKYGQIYQTNNKILGSRFEDRYLFEKIEYRYDGDFVIEIDYFCTWSFVENRSLYSRLYYEFEK